MSESLWKSCLRSLEREIPEQQLNTWIRPLQAEEDSECLRLYAPNRFVLDWVREHFADRIRDLLVALRPVAEPAMPDLRLRVSRTLWVMPLTALNLLFAVFVAVQITVLFGGNERVLTTAGLTYAEYARSGFFELATVSVFVLAIVAAACGGLSLERGRDRRLLAALLGPLCALTLVILASALHRLDLYVDAYGLSRLRAVVIATCWWLAAVFLVVLVAGVVVRALGTRRHGLCHRNRGRPRDL